MTFFFFFTYRLCSFPHILREMLTSRIEHISQSMWSTSTAEGRVHMMWDSSLNRCFHAIIYFTHICSHIRPTIRATPIRVRMPSKLRSTINSRQQHWVNNKCYTFHTVAAHNVALLIAFIFKFTFMGAHEQNRCFIQSIRRAYSFSY